MLIQKTKNIRAISIILMVLCVPFNIFCQSNKPIKPAKRTIENTLPDSIPVTNAVLLPADVVVDSIGVVDNNVVIEPIDSFPIVDNLSADFIAADSLFESTLMPNVHEFTPDPIRAVWLSALFPGLGQIYNRRFWKLPIVVGGFMGLAYGTSWNNMMLRDYTRAYSDLMDNDPNTRSYMDFFPPTVQESDLDASWLESILKRRKDYYRRNRDLCIISMVGVYLLAMVDAYVDASLAHFDISPDLSMDVTPAFIPDIRHKPGIGIQWAFTF